MAVVAVWAVQAVIGGQLPPLPPLPPLPLSYSEARRRRQHDLPALDRRAGEGIALEQRRAVQVHHVEEWREVRRGGNPMDVSIMQPTITSMWWARATAIMRSASRSEPHLASLMLMPSTNPTRRGMSAAVRHDSSATIGMLDALRTSPSPLEVVGRQRLLDQLDAVLLPASAGSSPPASRSSRSWRPPAAACRSRRAPPREWPRRQRCRP